MYEPWVYVLITCIRRVIRNIPKNLLLLGDQSSEAVIFLNELCIVEQESLTLGSAHSPTAIGRYLGPVDIGLLIGLVVQRNHNSIDERTMVHVIKDLFKKVITRRQYEIKQAITDDLLQTIGQDNKQYKEIEHALIKQYNKKERADLKNALFSLSHTWNKGTETVVINKLNTPTEQDLFAQLKDIHRKLRQNRTFLDLEQRSCSVESPSLKDSMGAFIHALIRAIPEEGTLYLHNNTINLLLAVLWNRAKNKDEINEALTMLAQTLSIEPDCLYTWHPQDPYTIKNYEALKAKTGASIATLPLEDIVFARVAYRIYDRTLQNSQKITPCPYAATYFKNFVHQISASNNQDQKGILDSLICSWAPTWSDVNTMDPKIIYCRFLMQPTDTVSDRLALLVDICQGKINMTGMVSYYLNAIPTIYQTCPKNFQTQRMIFDRILKLIFSNPPADECTTVLKTNCSQWIKQADDSSKAAVLYVMIKNHLFDTSHIEGFEPFDAHHSLIDMAKSIQPATFISELITLFPIVDTPKNDHENQVIQELSQWAITVLPAITDESTKIVIIKKLMHDKTPDDSMAKQPFQGYYSWVNTTVTGLKDDNKKTDLILDTLTRCSRSAFPTDKHHLTILGTLINKTLPSIAQDAAIVKIMTLLVNTFPCENEQFKELYGNAYDWLAEKLPLIADEKAKLGLINLILARISNLAMSETSTLISICKAVKKGLQSIHNIKYKTQAMQLILDRRVIDQEPGKELYKTMYQWIETNIPDIKDSHEREKMLMQLLQATKKA